MAGNRSTQPISTTAPPVTAPLTKSRNFTAMLAATAVSSAGDGVRLAAFPLLAITITSNPVAITGIATANRLPWLFVALFSGAIADRYDRRTLMIMVDIVRATAMAALAVSLLVGADHLVILYIVAAMLGIGETLFSSAAQALIPDIVPSTQLAKANGRLMTVQMVGSNFLGPMLGSWFFGLGKAVPFIIDALSFVVGSALLAMVPKTGTPQSKPSGKSLLGEIGEGIRWVWGHPLMRSFLLVITVVNLTQSASQSLLVLLAIKELGMSTATFGLLLAASGVATFLGGMLSSHVGDRLGVPYVLWPSIALTCPLFLLVSWTDQPLVLGAVLAVNAFLGLLANVQMASLRQRLVPRDRIGRVSSVNMFLAFGFAIPAGALGAGFLAHYTSTRFVYVICGAIVLALVVVVAREMRPAAVKKTIARLLEQQS